MFKISEAHTCCLFQGPASSFLTMWVHEQEHKFWEESFRVYEKGVAIFKYPHVKDIWLAYLQHFVKRYGGTKLERARDLFKQALREVPPSPHLACKA